MTRRVPTALFFSALLTSSSAFAQTSALSFDPHIDIPMMGAFAAQSAVDEPVILTPFGDGGLRVAIQPSGFGSVASFVQVRPERALVPYDSRFRPECFIQSPWLPIGHGRGLGQFVPIMSVDWTGILFPRTGAHAFILNLQTAVKKTDGTLRTQRETVDSGRISHLQAISLLDNDAILYRGTFDNDLLSPRAIQAVEVEQGDEVQVSVCDLMGNVELSVRSLVFQSVPYAP